MEIEWDEALETTVRWSDPAYLVGTWQQAEKNAAAMMAALGYPDAQVTPPGPDGGIDVRSSTALAQVKHWASKSGVPHLQNLVGARNGEHKEQSWLISMFTRDHRHEKELWFFSKSGYAGGAGDYADRWRIRLFIYSDTGAITAENQFAVNTVRRARRTR